MRSLTEICELLDISQETGQAILRARDAFASSIVLEPMQYSAIDDYLMCLTLAIGRDNKNTWQFSPAMFYNLMTAVLVLNNIAGYMEELAEKLAVSTNVVEAGQEEEPI